MKLKAVNSYLSKVVAVMKIPDRGRGYPSDLVDAPPGMSDRDLVGSFVPTVPIAPDRPGGKTVFVVPTYFGGERLDRCLRTLRECHKGWMNFEIVVSFDGGPNPESARQVASRNKARFVMSKRNEGFSRAVNRGIRAADPEADHVILVNDDVWFSMPAGKILALALERYPDSGIVGGLLLYPDGRIQHAGMEGVLESRLRGKEVCLEAFEEREVRGVSGAFMGLSRRFLEQCGGFDERYTMAWEDLDLCLTARVLGWKVRYCGGAWAFHEEGGTRGGKPEEKEKHFAWAAWERLGRVRFEKKWGTEYAEGRWEKEPKRTKLRRLLVKRESGIREVLLTSPVVRALRERNPEAEIVVATRYPIVYRDNEDVTFVIPVDHPWVRNREADEFFDLDAVPLEGNVVREFADVCGVKVEGDELRVSLRDWEKEFAARWMPESFRWAVMCPGEKGRLGENGTLERFAEAAWRLREKGWRVVWVGDSLTTPVEGDIDLRGRTTFHQLGALIERADLFVGVDSVSMRLAEAFQKPRIDLSRVEEFRVEDVVSGREFKGSLSKKIFGVKWQAPFFDGSGYAEAARNYVSAVHTSGVPITIEEVSFEDARADYGEAGRIVRGLAGKHVPYSVNVVYMTPEHYPYRWEKDCYNIGFFFWETEDFPKEWLEPCRIMDELWVCCRWTAEVVSKAIPDKPVFHFGYCANLGEYERGVRNFEVEGVDPGWFKFYSIFQWTERKNPGGLLRAYLREFRKDDPVVLILKTYRSNYSVDEQNAVRGEIRRIQEEVGDVGRQPRVVFISRMLSRGEILGLHRWGDCFVLPHRSEGWGLPHFEATLMGKPVITTRFGGNLEFTKEESSYLVGYTLVPVGGMDWIPWYKPYMKWAEPSENELRRLMRHVFENREEAREKGRRGRMYAAERFNWEVVGRSIKNRLIEICSK